MITRKITRSTLVPRISYIAAYRGYATNSSTRFSLKTLKNLLELFWNKTYDKLHYFNSQVIVYSTKFKRQLNQARRNIDDIDKQLIAQARETHFRINPTIKTGMSHKATNLPSEIELHRYTWAKKLELYLDSLQQTIFTATKALNDVTGYSAIQQLRNNIDMMEKEMETIKQLVIKCKFEYNKAIILKAKSQKEVNELLQRKSIWTPVDLEKFTQLYKDDADNLKHEEEAAQALKDAEIKRDDLANALYRAILTRYHEEQIWSDKIRRTSTWGTFFLMGMNVILFLVFQLLLEPWKRRRLVGSFEDKVKQALDQYAIEQNSNWEDFSVDIANRLSKEKYNNNSIVSDHCYPVDSHYNHVDIILRPIPFHSWSDFRHYISYSLKTISLWVESLTKKIILLPVNNIIQTITLSKLEFYFYSSILLSVGMSLGRFIT